MGQYKFGSTSIARMQGVNPLLQKVAFRAIRISSRKKDGLDFTIPPFGGIRTAEEQNELFKQGVSKCDGFNELSYHQTGNALDVLPIITIAGKKGNRIYTKDVTNEERELAFHKVATCMLQAAAELGVKVQWGGAWSWSDYPHYEIRINV